MSKQLVLNGRWLGHFVIDGVKQQTFFIKDVVNFAAEAEAKGVKVVARAKTVAKLLSGRTDPPPGGVIGYAVILKTKTEEFGDDLAAAIKYRDRYQGELVEVAI